MNTYLQVSVFPSRTLNREAEVVLKQYETQQYSGYMFCAIIILYFLLEPFPTIPCKPCRKLIIIHYEYLHSIVPAYNIFGKLNARSVFVDNITVQQPITQNVQLMIMNIRYYYSLCQKTVVGLSIVINNYYQTTVNDEESK